MATPPLTDQERALLAQFVASSTSDPGNAPVLIQYALDRLARQPGSTLAEVIASLSPNGVDAGADFGPYLDVVNRTLGPSEQPMAYAESGGSGSSFDWSPFAATSAPFRTSPAPRAVATPAVPAPTASVAVEPVRVASLPPEAVPSVPFAETSVPSPQQRPAVPAPIAAAPVHNPIDDLRLPPATPQFVSPPRSTAIAPTGPFIENAPSARGSTVAKDQSRLTDAPNTPKLAFNEAPYVTQEGLNVRPVQTVSIDPSTGMPRTSSPAPQASYSGPRVDPGLQSATIAHEQQLQLDDRLALAAEQEAAGGLPWNTGMAQDPRLVGALQALAESRAPKPMTIGDVRLPPATPQNPPMPATASATLRQNPNGVKLTPEDREYLARAVATEVDPRIARTNPEAYALQAQRVVDTILNRVASPQFPDTVADVVNQKHQFSAINGPTGRPGERYGTVQNVPSTRADESLRSILSSYLDERVAGTKPSSVGGAVNYANPKAADASNLKWINSLDMAVDNAGPFSHRYGVAQGYQPFEASFARPAETALGAANALATGSIGSLLTPSASDKARAAGQKKTAEVQQVKVSADPITDAWTKSAFASPPQTQEKQQLAAAAKQTSRETPVVAWTSPQPTASDRVRAAQASAQTSRAASTASKVSSAGVASSSGNGQSGISSGGLSAVSAARSPTTSVGTKTSTTSTVGSSKSATTSKTTTSSSTKSSTSASDKVRGRG